MSGNAKAGAATGCARESDRGTEIQTDIYAASFVDISLKVSSEHCQQSNQKQTMGKNVRKHNQR